MAVVLASLNRTSVGLKHLDEGIARALLGRLNRTSVGLKLGKVLA